MGDAKAIDLDQAEDVLPDELAPGTELLHGQYKIDEFLNAGGFGMTYRARDSLDRKVVIKECFPGAFCRRSRTIVQARSRAHQTELNSIVRLFVQEARSLSKLQHPNIVGVHQVFEENGTAYMALDFVDGLDLMEILEDPDKTLTAPQIVSILRDILIAIGFVHGQDILHRDISPDNILLDASGRPVLIDFGAARQQATKQSRVLSALRVVKDGYSPQEFYITGTEQGPYSDLYALGASFYHLITGDVPMNAQARLTAIATGDGDPYEALKGNYPDFDDDFLSAIDKALEVLPKDRLQSAADWLAMMDGEAPAAFTGAKAAPAVTTDVPAKSRTALFAGVAAVALIAAGAGFMMTQSDTDEAAPAVEAAAVESAETAEVAPVEPAPQETAAEAVETTAFSGSQPAEADPLLPTPLILEQAAAAVDQVPQSPQLRPDLAVDATGPEATWVTLASLLPQPLQLRSDLDVDATRTIGAWTDIAALRPAPRPPVGPDPRPIPRPAPQLRADLEADTRAIRSGWFALNRQNIDRIARSQLVPTDTPIPAAETVLDTAFVAPAPEHQAPAVDQTVSEALILPPADEAGAGFTEMAPLEAVFLGEEIIIAEPAPAPEAPVQALTEVLSAWTLDMPFEDLNADRAGVRRVQSVNGVPVDGVDAFNRVLRAAIDPEGLTDVTFDVGIGTGPDDTTIQQTWTRPIKQETALLNGLRFMTVHEDDRWVTRVIHVPSGASTDLRVDDIVFAFVPTTETLTTRTAMQDLMEREIAAGRSDFAFAVQRDGSTWVASMTYVSVSQN